MSQPIAQNGDGALKLSGADRYNPNYLPQLEQFAEDQYDLAVSLALVRLYAIQPERFNTQLLGRVLIRSMIRLPEPDFDILLHLIPERLQDEQPIAALVALMQHLEGARFQTFWLAADACKDLLKSVPGFHEAMQQYILGALCSTCQMVAKETLSQSLRLDDGKTDELIQKKCTSGGWKTVQGANGRTYITLPKNNHNVIKQQTSQGGFRFETLAPLIAAT